jgi:hypothetical protein
MVSGHPVQIVLETLFVNNQRKISLRYFLCGRAPFLEREILYSNSSPTKKLKKIFNFHINLISIFIWLTNSIRAMMSLIYTLLTAMYQHVYGYLILC